MWAGWTVHVDDQASTKTYYARVSDRAYAVEAVKKHIDSTSSTIRFEARKPIQSTVFTAMGIAAGEVIQSP
jgi:hypothetical protein